LFLFLKTFGNNLHISFTKLIFRLILILHGAFPTLDIFLICLKYDILLKRILIKLLFFFTWFKILTYLLMRINRLLMSISNLLNLFIFILLRRRWLIIVKLITHVCLFLIFIRLFDIFLRGSFFFWMLISHNLLLL
jgi:hypothetical protein